MDLDRDISHSEVKDLLGLHDIEALWKNRELRSSPLMDDLVHLIVFQAFLWDVRVMDQLLRRLFLIIMRGCFLGNNSSMVHSSLVRSIANVSQISSYNCGSFTLDLFLRSLRRWTEMLTGCWFGFYHFLMYWAYEWLPCIRPHSTLGLDTYPRAMCWHYNVFDEVAVASNLVHPWTQLEMLTFQYAVWAPYLPEHGLPDFDDVQPIGPKYELSLL